MHNTGEGCKIHNYMKHVKKSDTRGEQLKWRFTVGPTEEIAPGQKRSQVLSRLL